MAEQNIELLLVTKPEDKYYLSGFESSNFYIVLTQNRDYLLTDFRYLEAARKKIFGFEIIKIDASYSIFDFLAKYDKMNIGIEENHLTAEDYKVLEKSFTSEKILFAQNIFNNQRMIKDEYEIRCIQHAAEIADYAFTQLLGDIAPGVSEKELALKLEEIMKREGASQLSFETIVASGERSSLPHGVATDKIIQKGDFITLDYGCIVDHYCSDMTRTVAVGKVSEDMKTVYEIVQAAQKKSLEKIAPGFIASDIDEIARKKIKDAGYGEFFGHGLGHGVGLEIHEAPRLSPTSHVELLEGMVVTVEPGIYLPNNFGVRIEDLVVITDNGINNLSLFTKELIIV